MRRIFTLILLAIAAGQPALADEITVEKVLYAGNFTVRKPFIEDSADLNNKSYQETDLLKAYVSFNNLQAGAETLYAGEDGSIRIPEPAYGYAVHLLSFYLRSDRYGYGTLKIDGINNVEMYVDREAQALSGNSVRLELEPRSYEIIMKVLSTPSAGNSLKISFSPEEEMNITSTSGDEKRQYALSDVTDGKRIQSASISPDAKYIIVSYLETFPGGQTIRYAEIVDRASGVTIVRKENAAAGIQWLPASVKAYYTRQGIEGRELVTLDPVSKTEQVIAAGLPDGSIRWSPAEDYFLLSIREEGPEERKEIQQILVPDDRQPGWRDRSFIHKYDMKTGVIQRLTFGHLSTSVNDISADGRYVLFSSSEQELTSRPFRRTNLYMMDMQNGEVKTLFRRAEFLGRALFSPEGKELLFSSSPEAFGGIGQKIKPGQTPSTSDGQLFIYDIAGEKVTALTKDFNPSVDHAVWNRYDNKIYVMAKDRDYVSLYSIDPVKGFIRQLPCGEEVVTSISLASKAPYMAYFGMGASNSHRLYVQELKKNTDMCLIDLSKEILKDVTLGEVKDWAFVSSAGDTIHGRYYLPPYFDPEKKYPMIVNYYGGVTPTARTLESRYPAHAYAGMGFVVYIVQPSGATGFGQEFSARHVNTWGKRTAEDIIEGTVKFCEEHPFINKDKIGCMGASYGGFMTMYLQTKTDIFAAAMSHAGISDITGYWGEGYWGYSYSETASANSYPWNAKEMYVGQSPLYSADRVNTPILFLHGAADTNVPISESIQMFTALKLLGKETAFVQVEGENHHILDYSKRILWNNTIYAWFFKWLKDDPAWWEALYPSKNL